MQFELHSLLSNMGVSSGGMIALLLLFLQILECYSIAVRSGIDHGSPTAIPDALFSPTTLSPIIMNTTILQSSNPTARYRNIRCLKASEGPPLKPHDFGGLVTRLASTSKSVTIFPGSQGWHEEFGSCHLHVFAARTRATVSTKMLALALLRLKQKCETLHKYSGGGLDLVKDDELVKIRVYTYNRDLDDSIEDR